MNTASVRFWPIVFPDVQGADEFKALINQRLARPIQGNIIAHLQTVRVVVCPVRVDYNERLIFLAVKLNVPAAWFPLRVTSFLSD